MVQSSRISDIFTAFAILLSVAILVSWLGLETVEDYSGPVEKEYVGVAWAIDGDTLMVDHNKIRLEGIDAPEKDQTCSIDQTDYQCGVKAWRYLQALLKLGRIRCKAWRRDRYGRLLGRCFAGKIKVNARMIHAGWAVSFGNYYKLQNDARRNKNGIWAGKFDYPQDWRRRQRDNL